MQCITTFLHSIKCISYPLATSDYSPTTTNTVNVNAGVVVGGNVCFTVTIIDDILVENNETFIITISAGAKSSVMTPRIISYITIIDNDGKCFFASLETFSFPILQCNNTSWCLTLGNH